MAEGIYERHYKYAKAHPNNDKCKLFLDLAQLYARHADGPTLGLIQGAAKDIEKLMTKDTTP